MGRRAGHSQRGTLLVEALVSFSLFLLASIAFYGMMANTRRADAKARHVLEANAYARQLMESQRIKGYSNLKAGTTRGSKSFSVQALGLKGKTKTSGATNMATSITIYEGPGAGVRSILVVVSWNDGTVQLESYVTK